jgi:adenosylcobalamin-dependent ribonucleoside-triphosphate reductase
MFVPSTRAQIITRRTYNRPLNEAGTEFETWEQTVDRVIAHQKWLWERALTQKSWPDMPLNDITEDMQEWVCLVDSQLEELAQLRELLLERKVAVAGRTLWLGGTNIAKTIAMSQFNCAAINAQTVHDIVDIFWGLLNGSGMGFRPVPGTLTGFRKVIPKVTFIPSTRTADEKGTEFNEEYMEDGIWYIRVGDSAIAWAKSVGKILAGKYNAKELIIDFSEIRGGGKRLRNYGWLSQGSTGLMKSYKKIVDIMNKRADSLLSSIDILDVVNLLGTVLSTRRSAQIAIMDYSSPEWELFARAKSHIFSNDGSETGLEHRTQSNNSILFDSKPSKKELSSLLWMMHRGGKGEPGLINGVELKRRAPWATLMNPCAEILLPSKGGTCNLVSIDLGKFKGSNHELHDAARIISRANYRQTCVDFRDGILQESWSLNSDHLRLCGVSLMGVAKRPDMGAYEYRTLRRHQTSAAYSMAEELDLPYPKNISTIKPEGTQSKCYDSTEGMHKPLGKYIFNNVAFSIHDPLIDILRKANYRVFAHPYDTTAMLVTLPISYEDVKFDVVDGKEVNLESAVDQLNRYKMLMDNYCDQNVSCTISYDENELEDITDWLYSNWDSYVAVSFLKRNDPSKTAKDLGYPYLPQEVVTEAEYLEYTAKLLDINLDSSNSHEELLEEGCSGGVCPIR